MVLSFIRARVVLKVVETVVAERCRPPGSMTTYFDQPAAMSSASGDAVRPIAIHIVGAAFLNQNQYFQLN